MVCLGGSRWRPTGFVGLADAADLVDKQFVEVPYLGFTQVLKVSDWPLSGELDFGVCGVADNGINGVVRLHFTRCIPYAVSARAAGDNPCDVYGLHAAAEVSGNTGERMTVRGGTAILVLGTGRRQVPEARH